MMEKIRLIQNIAGNSRTIIINDVKYIISEIIYMGEREELELIRYDAWEELIKINIEKDTN